MESYDENYIIDDYQMNNQEAFIKGKEFDVNKITKYFKNQSVPYDLTVPFIDDIFPPNDNSLYSLDKNTNKPIDKINYDKNAEEMMASINSETTEWKRISEVIPDFVIFEDEIEFKDIKQGSLGNCYFLSALATLSDYPNLIYKIFKTKEESPIGFYEIAFFIDGEWNIVIIDDYIPYDKICEDFAFAKPNDKEVWVILIEKAWAKINGGYLNTIAGLPVDPFTALTGFSKKCMRLDNFAKENNYDGIWKIIWESLKKNHYLACSTPNNVDESMGVYGGHAYSLLSAKQTNHEGNELRLLKIRNPHGSFEWKGEWSDKSDLWTERLNEIFGHKISGEEDYDDGLFFISLEDFLKYYDQLFICFPIYNSQIKSFLIGENTELELNEAHVFSLNIPTTSEVSLIAHIPFWRYNRHLVNKNHPINILVAKVNEELNSLEFCDGDFNTKDDLMVRKNLKQGNYLIWVYAGENQENKRIIKNYRLKICANSRFTCNYEKKDEDFLIMKEILLSGVEEQYKEEIENNKNILQKFDEFKETGIFYYYLYNSLDYACKYAIIGSDDPENCDLKFLKPYENKERIEVVFSKNEKVLICALKSQNSLNFSVKTSIGLIQDEENQGYESPMCQKPNIEDYLTKEKLDITPEDEYYDYISPSVESLRRKIDFTNKHHVQEISKEEIEKEHPEVMEKLAEFVVSIKENKENEEVDESEKEKEQEYYNEDANEVVNNNIEEYAGGQKKITTDNGYYIGFTDEYNHFNGYGVFSFPEGSMLIGKFRDDMLHGDGEEWYQGTLIYKGQYKKGEKTGKGTLIYSDGTIYEGKLRNCIRNGKGRYTDIDGNIFEGTYMDDEMHGKGTYYFPDGSFWVGKFKHGYLHGRGTFTDSNGESRIVVYKDSVPVEE